MWSQFPCSKLIHQRSQQKCYQIHQEHLRKMSPTLRITLPQQPSFIFSKPKQEMARRDRQLQIDYENMLLLLKMDQVHNHSPQPPTSTHTIPVLRPSNPLRKKVEVENRRICDKLIEVHSHYPTARILTQSQQLKLIGSNISFNARRTSLRPNSALTRTGSKSRFVRSGGSKENQILTATTEAKTRPDSAPSGRSQKSEGIVLVNNVCSGGEELI